MAFKLLARTRETTATTGTGAITLGGAASGDNVPFSAGLADGDTTFACIVSGNGVDWEECIATYGSSGNTLTRGTVIINSAGGTSHVSLTGTSRAFAIVPNDFTALFNQLGGGDTTKFLRGDGTFDVPGGSGGAYGSATTATANNTSGTLSLTGIAAFTYLEIIADQLVVATDKATIQLQFGTGGTPTWVTANYAWAEVFGGSASGPTKNGSDSDSGIFNDWQLSNSRSGQSLRGLLTKQGSHLFHLTGTMASWEGSSGTPHFYSSAIAGFIDGSGADITALRFVTSAGNLVSGQVSVIPITP